MDKDESEEERKAKKLKLAELIKQRSIKKRERDQQQGKLDFSEKWTQERKGTMSKERFYVKKFDCPLGLVACIRENCRYFSLVSQCRYERIHAAEEKDDRIREAEQLVRVSESPLKGSIK